MFGSISNQRIDFNSLKRTLEAFNNLEYHFIGPSDIDVELEHERIKFYGTLNYDDIYSYVKNFDCLIMPFRMDKLVEYMDPVKLYLYINYNKPIIARYYKG